MIEAILMDLDGVVHRGREPVEGSVRFLERWSRRGIRFAFLTNRSGRRVEDIVRYLAGIGVECEAEQILTSAAITADEVAGKRVFAIGGEGLFEALRGRGCDITDEKPVAVVVGGDPGTTSEQLVTAVRLIRGGADFLATNGDRLVNTENGVVPGNGATVEALAYATGVRPRIMGKPEPRMIERALELLDVSADRALLVGDNLETDVEAGRRARVRTVHLLTGVSSGDHVTLRDYGELEDHVAELEADDRR